MLLCSSEAPWWVVLLGGSQIFQQLPPMPTTPFFFAPGFLASEEGATHVGLAEGRDVSGFHIPLAL